MKKYEKPMCEIDMFETGDSIMASGVSFDENHNFGDGLIENV